MRERFFVDSDGAFLGVYVGPDTGMFHEGTVSVEIDGETIERPRLVARELTGPFIAEGEIEVDTAPGHGGQVWDGAKWVTP